MAKKIHFPTVIEAVGNKPKFIEEYIGAANTDTPEVSIARMRSPQGWIEPGQRPACTEYTLVLNGALQVATRQEVMEVRSGEAVIVPAGEWVQYSSPHPDGAEYIAVCIPAFTPETVNRDNE
jgi:mannose-6-phosphate isomerase-like protein (cupin superfamily)